jgi:transcriptional regulator with XRE-family HTH domain
METANTYSVYEAPPLPSETKPNLNPFVIWPLYVALVAGTGGVYSSANISVADELSVTSVIDGVPSRGQRTESSTFASQMLRLREVFGLSMSEFAAMFGVSRPTGYAWLRGAEPRADLIDKMWMLNTYADDFEKLNVSHLSSFLRRPLVNGRTLLDLLTSGEHLDDALVKIKQLAHQDRAAAERIASSPSRNRNSTSIFEISSVTSESE